MDDRELFEKALSACANSYSPYSGFKVGAALLLSDGTCYTGTNIENASYGACICAERVAAVKAVSEGRTDFVKIVVASPSGKASPCGICRQFLYEFAPDMKVITEGTGGELDESSLSDLLKDGFRLADDK